MVLPSVARAPAPIIWSVDRRVGVIRSCERHGALVKNYWLKPGVRGVSLKDRFGRSLAALSRSPA